MLHSGSGHAGQQGSAPQPVARPRIEPNSDSSAAESDLGAHGGIGMRNERDSLALAYNFGGNGIMLPTRVLGTTA